MKLVVLLLAIALLTAACSDPQPNGTPRVAEDTRPAAKDNTPSVPAGPTGRIRGVVHFMGRTPAAATEPVSENQSVCGSSVKLPRLALGKENGVRHAFLYLEGVPASKSAAAPQPVLIDQKNCQYVPHVVVVPVGTRLEITNSDSILHNVHGIVVAQQGMKTLFNIAQPVRGQRTLVEPALTDSGIVTLSCEAGHPWMSAYVFVADNPFVVTTNDDGEFVIPNVPAGTYGLKLWHEGITLKRNIKTLQRYEYEEPYELSKDVVVSADAEAVVNFDLSLRPAS